MDLFVDEEIEPITFLRKLKMDYNKETHYSSLRFDYHDAYGGRLRMGENLSYGCRRILPKGTCP